MPDTTSPPPGTDDGPGTRPDAEPDPSEPRHRRPRPERGRPHWLIVTGASIGAVTVLGTAYTFNGLSGRPGGTGALPQGCAADCAQAAEPTGKATRSGRVAVSATSLGGLPSPTASPGAAATATAGGTGSRRPAAAGPGGPGTSGGTAGNGTPARLAARYQGAAGGGSYVISNSGGTAGSWRLTLTLDHGHLQIVSGGSVSASGKTSTVTGSGLAPGAVVTVRFTIAGNAGHPDTCVFNAGPCATG